MTAAVADDREGSMADLKRKIGEAVKSDKFSAGTVTALIIAVVMVFNILLYVIVESFGLYFSVKDRDDVSLSGNTDMLFAEAISEGKKVKISFCNSDKKALEQHEKGSLVYESARYFEERYPEFIELDFINIITKVNKDGEIVDLDKYTKDKDGNEININRASVIFECGENYRVLTDAIGNYTSFYTLEATGDPTSYNGEEVIAAAVGWVTRPEEEHKKVYFTQYHGETADINLSNLFFCAGYEVDVIDLRKSYVPADADLVVISSPTGDFEKAREGSEIKAEIDKLEIYMQSGGNLFVTLDPYVKSLPVLEGFLARWGIKFSVTELSDGRTVRNMVKDSRDAITTDGFTLVTGYAEGELAKNIEKTVSSYSDGRVIVREASALELSGAAQPLLISSAASTLSASGNTVSASGSYCVGAYSSLDEENGKSSKVFVVPSIYLAAADALVSNGYSNKDFVYSLLEELYGASGMPYGTNQVVFDDATLQNLTMGAAKLYTALTMVIPAALVVVCVVITVRRRNR